VSIINEALRKTQERKEELKQPLFIQSYAKPFPNKKMAKIVGLTSLLLLAALLVVMSNYHSRSSKPAVLSLLSLKTEHELPNKMKTALNGVFVSERMKVAYADTQAFHIGDTINGLKIVDITLDSIKLQHEKGIIEIHTGESVPG